VFDASKVTLKWDRLDELTSYSHSANPKRHDLVVIRESITRFGFVMRFHGICTLIEGQRVCGYLRCYYQQRTRSRPLQVPYQTGTKKTVRFLTLALRGAV